MEHPALAGQYHLGKTIGCGGFAKVKLATHILTGEKVAIKIMRKQSLKEDLPRVKHEINALKSLSHNNICKLYQIVETVTHYFLVMEYCSGGELFDHIVQKEKLTEDEARVFFQQIVSAVSYLHKQGFAHRDLKPENILLDKKHNLKLIDFGLSVKPENGSYSVLQRKYKFEASEIKILELLGLEACLYTSCGSPNYAAPELIKGEKYLGPEIDIWSLGVLLYALLCGSLPFDDSSIQKLYEKILSGYYEEKKWLSAESKSLLNSLLQVNARKRISTEKLKLHPWFKKGFEKPDSLHSGSKIVYDEEIIQLLSENFNLSTEYFWNEIKKENYDYMMATYLLLLDKKKNNEPVELLNELPSPRKKVLSMCAKQLEESQKIQTSECPLTRMGTYVIKREREGIRGSLRHDENRQSGRRNCKRIRSPGIGERNGPEAKRMKQNKTPVSKKSIQNDSTPHSAKKILDGLEWGISKAKAALTPCRKNNGRHDVHPVVLWGKDLCNVSSTTSTSPDDILAQLQKALNAKGIICTKKGYTLRGKLKLQSLDKKKAKDQEDKLSFELEVCWIPPPIEIHSKNTRSKTADPLKGAVVGIRRKRLRGDAWIYKNICEEVLALAAH